MKAPKLSTLTLAVLTALATGFVVADDGGNGQPGKPVLKSMSKLPTATVAGHIDEAEHAFIHQMKFYVPMQAANGTALEVSPDPDAQNATAYTNIDGVVVTTRTLAKPLIGVYMYGPVVEVPDVGFIGHGKRDAYGAISLDDGVTWKKTNLSESAMETSCDNANCNVTRADIPLFADTAYNYPGDVTNVFHSIAGNKALVAWQSRYCGSGQPNYSLDNPDDPATAARRAAIATYLGIDLTKASPDDLYLLDMYGVGGSQGSVNYAEEDDYVPNQAVGEVPYNCLWTARGVLNQGDDPRTTEVTESSYMRWFKAERLTSGRRDVNRVETVCVAGAGCAITWQEDPDGLRGGQGEGPGEGWSGAVANSGTDVWYSYIDADHFDVVQNPTDATGATSMTLVDYEALAASDPATTQKPKPFVPFAMPMRLTDNAKCNVTNPTPYCYGAALATAGVAVPTDDSGIVLDPRNYGLKDLCKDTVTVLTGNPDSTNGEKETQLCVTEAGLPLVGNTAATRPRLAVYGYDSRAPKNLADSVIYAVVAEEDKGLGAFTFDANGNPCDQVNNSDPLCFTFDEGKNIKYFTFSMQIGDMVGGKAATDGLLANLT
ncbi:MAG: choice-of-anchor O protein, partial [Thiobacillaceae bacterium]|nr:choice-of-anchor O protein [Thiobacillaceae bacterium]